MDRMLACLKEWVTMVQHLQTQAQNTVMRTYTEIPCAANIFAGKFHEVHKLLLVSLHVKLFGTPALSSLLWKLYRW